MLQKPSMSIPIFLLIFQELERWIQELETENNRHLSGCFVCYLTISPKLILKNIYKGYFLFLDAFLIPKNMQSNQNILKKSHDIQQKTSMSIPIFLVIFLAIPDSIYHSFTPYFRSKRNEHSAIKLIWPVRNVAVNTGVYFKPTPINRGKALSQIESNRDTLMMV